MLDAYSFGDIQHELKGSTEIVEEMLPIRPVATSFGTPGTAV